MGFGLVIGAAWLALAAVEPAFDAARANEWRFARGEWRWLDGSLEQLLPERQTAAIWLPKVFADFTLTVEMAAAPEGTGVRAGAILFGATGTMTYDWLHLDTRNDQVILVRSSPQNTWQEIRRARVALDDGRTHEVRLDCAGPRVTVTIDGRTVLEADDPARVPGRIGLGTSQGRVAWRRLRIEGEAMDPDAPLADEEPPYLLISRGEAAGPYQAFPDVCRLPNGELLCVFYAGYGHVSLPTAEWPKGGRICLVRSGDEGRTWSPPTVLYDDADDNRDPHIAVLPDGSLICTFFSLYPQGQRWGIRGVQAVRSNDNGATWTEPAELLLADWAVSAPVRVMPDGTCLLGVYREGGGFAYGGVIRSEDGGRTWSPPVPIGEGAKLPLDAETDVILLRDGTLYAALRSSRVNMHYAVSSDLGRSWSEVKDIGFPAHAPHLYRLSDGTILMGHRLPNTALHVSRDECRTWQGPYQVDTVIGAYPSTVELADGTVLVVYYEEGAGSAIRAQRFRVHQEGITPLPPAGDR